MTTQAPTAPVRAPRHLLPAVHAVIERRLLVNYRLDPDRAAALLPPALRPQLINGHAVAGICLIRLGHLRSTGAPAALGLRTENAAHRIAVQWQEPTGTRTGVYIPRRDTSSPLTTLLGGRLYPGHHHRADFTANDTPSTPGPRHDDAPLSVTFTSRDGTTSAAARVRPSEHLTGSRLFPDVSAASDFFAAGSCGYSPTRDGRHLEGMRLDTDAWSIQACELLQAQSSLFENPQRFPAGTAELDSALLMREVPVTWAALAPLPSQTPSS